MKHKTSELTGELLDQAVAKACGYLYDAEINEDFVVIALDPQIPRGGAEVGNVRCSECRIAVDHEGEPLLHAEVWKAGPGRTFPGTVPFCPSTRWEHGGPLLDKYDVALSGYAAGGTRCAEIRSDDSKLWREFYGATGLEAGMRAIVYWQLGPEVELP